MEILSNHTLIEIFNKTNNSPNFEEEFIIIILKEIERRNLRVASCKKTKKCLILGPDVKNQTLFRMI